MTADFVTVIQASYPINKTVRRTSSGSVEKSSTQPVSEAMAQTIWVPDAQAFASLWRQVAADSRSALILGYIPETVPPPGESSGTPYRILSRKRLGQALAYLPHEHVRDELYRAEGAYLAARVKDVFSPTTWMLLDRDVRSDMPDELRLMSDADWLEVMEQVLPGLRGADHVRAPSTSRRVLVDGNPLAEAGEHVFVRVTDADLVEDKGSTAFKRLVLAGYGYRSKSGSNRSQMLSVIDRSTFSHGRLVYSGLPVLEGEGLSIDDADLQFCVGSPLDITAISPLSDEEMARLRDEHGVNVQIDGSSSTRSFVEIDGETLRADTNIETEHGPMSVEAFWRGSFEKLRCQVPFRASYSWNGFLARHKDRTPFFFDNGTRTRYSLGGEYVRDLGPGCYADHLEAMGPDWVAKHWLDGLEYMSASGRERVLVVVKRMTGIPLAALRSDLVTKKRDRANHTLLQRSAGGSREAVIWEPSQLNSVVDKVAEIVLGRSDPEVFVHASRLVSIAVPPPTTVGELTNRGALVESACIRAHSPRTLALSIDRWIEFHHRDLTSGVLRPIEVPHSIADTMVQEGWTRAHPLTGVLTHPTVTPEGELLERPGYHAPTGLYFTAGARLAPESGAGSLDGRPEAYRYLAEEVFADFPFASALDAAVAVSCLLTAMVRVFLPKSPGYMVSAPAQGTGKTALFQLISSVLYGSPTPAMSLPRDEVEMSKTILAVLLGGTPMVLFDNVDAGAALESSALASAMTSPVYSSRLLGESRQVQAPALVLWAFTGNNIAPKGDMNTRLLLIHLDSRAERPDRRAFRRADLTLWALENRSKVIRAGLTLLCSPPSVVGAAQMAGGGESLSPTRYPEWDRLVRRPILDASGIDVADAVEANYNEDSELKSIGGLFEAWHGVHGEAWLQAKDLGEREDKGELDFLVDEDEVGATLRRTSIEWDLLCESLSELIPPRLGRLVPDPRSIGSLLGKLKGRAVGGYVLEMEPRTTNSKGAARWRVRRVSGV